MVLSIVISVLILGVLGLLAFAMLKGCALNIHITHTMRTVVPPAQALENKPADADKNDYPTMADVVSSINSFMLGEDTHE